MLPKTFREKGPKEEYFKSGKKCLKMQSFEVDIQTIESALLVVQRV